MSTSWPRLRLLGGVLVLALVLWRFGTGPFADAWRATTGGTVLAAVAVNVAGTLACAWRWRVVARALGAPLSFGASVTAYYRSQALNSLLPGGVLGDAHRGIRHGRAAGEVGLGLRATAWDRITGQVVQACFLLGALLLVGGPWPVWTAYAVLAGPASLGLLAAARPRPGSPFARVVADLRRLGTLAAAPWVVLASAGASAAHVTGFLVAAHAVGVRASLPLLATIALVVLVGSAVPLSVAGWGPREGVAVWAFAAAGLGSATGLTVSVEYGVLAAVATAPGAAVLLADLVRGRRRTATGAPARPLAEVSHG
jgi:uncharacterized membrane protein YbhN (UPF0104 family)